ncbi:MAG: SpoIIIAH-like family protein, partial [Eubacteriales bacterium]|nr:SpoIIIAH-like family protein [Eubacteriales bacterium]
MEKPKKSVKKAARRRLWILAGLIALAAGLWIWQAQPMQSDEPTPAPDAAPKLQQERDARETAYDKDVAALTAIMSSFEDGDEVRSDAARQLQRLVAQHQTEVAVGQALREAGYAPSLTLCQNGALTVMIEADELSAADSAVILSLCAAHSDVSLENIRVMT